MKKVFALTIFTFFLAGVVNAQTKRTPAKPSGQKNIVSHDISTNKNGIVTHATIINGDTLPLVKMQSVYIVDKREFKNVVQEWRYKRLVKNVKKAYPYAKIAGVKVREYNKILVSAKTEKEKARLLKECEDKLVAKFEKDIQNLTMSQGQILLKLIDRESGRNSYEIVKQFRGNTSAFFWQTLARVFGNNLKEEYDPVKDDKDVENIVTLIDKGLI